MIFTAQHLADHLTGRGARVVLDVGTNGDARSAVLAFHGGRVIVAAFPTNGRFYHGVSLASPDGQQVRHASLKSLVDTLDLPVPAATSAR